MKRIHIGLEVADVDRSVGFYSDLFGAPPTLRKADYAKWQLEDPRVNFSISARGEQRVGEPHFGVQVESEAELAEVAGRLERAGREVLAQPGAVCCYHRSEKAWVMDPDALRWETFYTRGESTVYGEDTIERGLEGESAGREGSRCCD